MPSLSEHDVTPSARQHPAFTVATVSNGPVDASYRRVGRGATVVALAAPDWPGGPALFAAHANDFRLIVPTLDRASSHLAHRTAFADWLTAFLDGLGLDAVILAADERFGAAALGSALLEPERVRSVAILLDGLPNTATDTTIAETLYCTRTTIHVGWLGTDHDAAARGLARRLLVRGGSTD